MFYLENSHVGIVGGWNEDWQLLIIRYASGYNNTVIIWLERFTSIGQPTIYPNSQHRINSDFLDDIFVKRFQQN